MQRGNGEWVPVVIKSKERIELFKKKIHKLLKENGFNTDHVYVYVSSNKDVKAYSEAFPECKIVKAPKGVTQTDNFITRALQKNKCYIHMSGDADGLYKLMYARPRRTSRNRQILQRHLTGGRVRRAARVPQRPPCCRRVKNIKPILKKLITKMKRSRITLGGCHPVPNPQFMQTEIDRNTEETRRLCLIMDPLVVVRNVDLQFGNTFKSDSGKCIRRWSQAVVSSLHSLTE